MIVQTTASVGPGVIKRGGVLHDAGTGVLVDNHSSLHTAYSVVPDFCVHIRYAVHPVNENDCVYQSTPGAM